MEKYSSVRDLGRWQEDKYFFSSLDEFVASKSIPNGILTINVSGYPLDLNVRIIPGAPITFLFHGAMPRSRDFKLPIFSGYNIVADDYSRVMISDPTLLTNNEITLGWYLGAKNLNLQIVLSLIIAKIYNYSDSSRAIFIGGSGGGFAALYYGQKIEGSIVVAANPQTNIFRYYKSHIHRFLGSFACEMEEARKLLDYDLCSVYSNIFPCFVFYIQNKKDDFHLKHHCEPFIKNSAKRLNNKLFLDLHDWGDGHKPPPPKYWKRVVDFFAEYPNGLLGVFESPMFKKFIEASKIDFEKPSVDSNNQFNEASDFEKLNSVIFSGAKPEPLVFRRYFDMVKSYASADEAARVFELALKFYPYGWSVKLAYAKVVADFGDRERSLALVKEIGFRLGEKTPEAVIKFIEVLEETEEILREKY